MQKSPWEKVNPSLRAIFCISPYPLDRNGSAGARGAPKGLFSIELPPALLTLVASFPRNNHKFGCFVCLPGPALARSTPRESLKHTGNRPDDHDRAFVARTFDPRAILICSSFEFAEHHGKFGRNTRGVMRWWGRTIGEREMSSGLYACSLGDNIFCFIQKRRIQKLTFRLLRWSHEISKENIICFITIQRDNI